MDMVREQLFSHLEKIGSQLKKPARIVLIGSSVGMLHGQPSRMTEDVDVWRPSSVIDEGDLKQACIASGMLFNPTDDMLDHDLPYLQLISPGIVHIGDYKNDLKLYNFGNLEVLHPPIENIIASKLLRAEPRDIEDIIFLRKKFSISYDDIERAISTLPESRIETARENVVYLEVADSSDLRLGEI